MEAEVISGSSYMIQWAINLYTQTVQVAVPIALVFGIGNLLVSTFLRVAFGGRLEFRGGR